MLLGANQKDDVPELEAMLSDIDTAEKMTAFVQAVSEELIAFYTPTKADKPEAEDASKNG